jgi:cytochrome c553
MMDMTGVEPWEVCGECHGLDGAGNRIKFPRLAGQKRAYIIKQLLDFRAGRRKNDGGQMQKTATELDEPDIPRVADWFASQTPPWPEITIEASPDLTRARQMAMSGADGIPACLSCHRTASLRVLDRRVDAPRLAGQRDYYIAKELTDFREGRRGNDPGQMMSQIARRLSDADIVGLAVFLSQNPHLHEAAPP